KEGRLLMQTTATSNFDPPNFRTILPLPVLLEGYRGVLASVYAPSKFYDRCYRSLLQWNARKPQKPPEIPLAPLLGIVVRSIVHQGILSSYRRAYWKFLLRLVVRCSFNPPKFSLGFAMLLSGHHFIRYARNLTASLKATLDQLQMGEAHEAIAAVTAQNHN
ncbi:MAG: DUF4070 domain-containing protein, partial [Terriglobia bacterium]